MDLCKAGCSEDGESLTHLSIIVGRLDGEYGS
jgi:hypothetical protein